jgi:hypothetical protein
MVLEEIWCEPDGAFLQVWLGTGGEPVHLVVRQATASELVFEGPPGRFPERIEYRLSEEG